MIGCSSKLAVKLGVKVKVAISVWLRGGRQAVVV